MCTVAGRTGPFLEEINQLKVKIWGKKKLSVSSLMPIPTDVFSYEKL